MLFGVFSDIGICEQPELYLAAWNIGNMNNKSRTDAELKAIPRTLANYDFIAIVELRDELETLYGSQ